MIKITAQEFYSETRMELANKIGELKRGLQSKISRLQVLDSTESLEFNYVFLRAQLDVIVFLEYYLLHAKERNWLCGIRTDKPILSPTMLKKVIKETMQDILKKEPAFSGKYNTVYFTALHYLNRIEVQDDGT